MTLFSEAYDRVQKMIPKRDLQNSPRIRALEATLAELEKIHGSWKVAWGEINRLQRIHGSQIDLLGRGAFSDDKPSLPIAGAPGPLGVVFNFYTLPQAGQKRRYGVAGHSFVAAVELAAEPRAKTILQFGESGDPGSPALVRPGCAVREEAVQAIVVHAGRRRVAQRAALPSGRAQRRRVSR